MKALCENLPAENESNVLFQPNFAEPNLDNQIDSTMRNDSESTAVMNPSEAGSIRNYEEADKSKMQASHIRCCTCGVMIPASQAKGTA